jgi:hypothetical protein
VNSVVLEIALLEIMDREAERLQALIAVQAWASRWSRS